MKKVLPTGENMKFRLLILLLIIAVIPVKSDVNEVGTVYILT